MAQWCGFELPDLPASEYEDSRTNGALYQQVAEVLRLSSERETPMKLKLCRDQDCLKFGQPQPIENFPRNARYDTQGERDGKHPYCRKCCVRRTADYKYTLKVLAARTAVALPPSYLRRSR